MVKVKIQLLCMTVTSESCALCFCVRGVERHHV